MEIDYNDKKLSANKVYETLSYENGKKYVYERDLQQTDEEKMVKYFNEFKSIIMDICNDINGISLKYQSSNENVTD